MNYLLKILAILAMAIPATAQQDPIPTDLCGDGECCSLDVPNYVWPPYYFTCDNGSAINEDELAACQAAYDAAELAASTTASQRANIAYTLYAIRKDELEQRYDDIVAIDPSLWETAYTGLRAQLCEAHADAKAEQEAAWTDFLAAQGPAIAAFEACMTCYDESARPDCTFTIPELSIPPLQCFFLDAFCIPTTSPEERRCLDVYEVQADAKWKVAQETYAQETARITQGYQVQCFEAMNTHSDCGSLQSALSSLQDTYQIAIDDEETRARQACLDAREIIELARQACCDD